MGVLCFIKVKSITWYGNVIYWRILWIMLLSGESNLCSLNPMIKQLSFIIFKTSERLPTCLFNEDIKTENLKIAYLIFKGVKFVNIAFF